MAFHSLPATTVSQAREITDYLRQAVELGGSDLHLSAWAPPAARVGGNLVPLEDFTIEYVWDYMGRQVRGDKYRDLLKVHQEHLLMNYW